MLRCKDCENVQKDENKFHCKKCNSFNMTWYSIVKRHTELTILLREITLAQKKGYK